MASGRPNGMQRIGLALVLWLMGCGLYGQEGTADMRVNAVARVHMRNEKGTVAGEAWAVAIPGGYLTVRGNLAGAYRAEIVAGQLRQEVTEVRGEDVERNLIVLGTGLPPQTSLNPEALAVTEPSQWTIRCGAQPPIPVNEFVVRDLPAFGLVYLGRTAHGDTINGCPAWDENGRWSGVVVWESPLARPSVALVPASLAATLAAKPATAWAAWRGAQVADGVRFRNSLLLESLQDIWRSQYSSAIENLTLLLDKHPSHGRALYYRGYARAMSGDRAGAIEDYEQSVTHDPANTDAHFSLGFSYLLLKRKLEAMEQAKELDSLDAAMAMKLRMLIEAMSEPSPLAGQDSEPDSDGEPDADSDARPGVPPGTPRA